MTYYDKPSLKDLEKIIMEHSGVGHDNYTVDGAIGNSGRYPYGSGKHSFQHARDFRTRVKSLKQKGLSESDICKYFGISSTEFRKQISTSKKEVDKEDLAKLNKVIKEHPDWSDAKLAKACGEVSESWVRRTLNKKDKIKEDKATATANFLMKQVDKKGPIDVTSDIVTELPEVNKSLNISKEKLRVALDICQKNGYELQRASIPNATNPDVRITYSVLVPPGSPKNKRYDLNDIHTIRDYTSEDGGVTFVKKFEYPTSMDGKRIFVRYADDKGPDGVSGLEKDGLVELRRGCKDLDLRGDRYSQIRVLVDDKYYVKGMAMYSDDIPDGYDMVFNTNKSRDVPLHKVLKEIKEDPDNPFGSSIKDAELGGQYYYTDDNGEKKLGLINKRATEGDWSEWSDKLPSQFLAKQPLKLAKQQLGIAIQAKEDEYNDILKITNPTVRKKMLNDFAEACDYNSVHLYAAALPRQKYHVLIPMNTLKDNEIYAPKYENGEKVCLVRYPHAGTFEIPELVVNNNNPTAKKLLGDAEDAVGVTKAVADQLSGADYDGDTAMVIPNPEPGTGKVRIKTSPPLKDLEGFDPKASYGTTEKVTKRKNRETGETEDVVEYFNAAGEKIKPVSKSYEQKLMGTTTNLIMDMTIGKATNEELARAAKHSMVVIDARKHHLDWRTSEKENGIPELRAKYQGHYNADGTYHEGAATLLTRAKSPMKVPKREGDPVVNLKVNEGKIDYKGRYLYDPNLPEGAIFYRTATGDKLKYTKKKINKITGEEKEIEMMRYSDSTKMSETPDANTLVSKYRSSMELLYADYANKLKSMANTARKTSYMTKEIEKDNFAANIYSKEVESLNSKLLLSEKNSPRERTAQLFAASEINAKTTANPELKNDKEQLKKMRQQALSRARQKVGATRKRIDITDEEWEAIQNGAVSKTKLAKILRYADTEQVKQLATPRKTKSLTRMQEARIETLSRNGVTVGAIAKQLGLSPSTVSNHLRNK